MGKINNMRECETILYLARVEDRTHIWRYKIGYSGQIKTRFKDKRNYLDYEILAERIMPKDSIKHMESKFDDLMVGKYWENYGIPTEFYGKTEVIKPDCEDEARRRFDRLSSKIKQSTLDDFLWKKFNPIKFSKMNDWAI